ncbi:hypothetical protein [Christiangramia sp. OXR-203]|uniref:tetratricopeptide repeat protein n=1 Tax=Christiangramia sp. OXR-203 TaxID=3100176 RepID=UPI002AC94629|nr:hypothetical protein [Christiangramia sp. OXR-203]WPY97636.1 hypothetical protein T8I65_10665 [Christiangramia sp. OXR-203]
MKNFTFLILLAFSSSLIAQNENEDLAIFSKGEAVYNLIYEDFDIQYEIDHLDTTKVEEKIEYELLREMKSSILERSLEYYEEVIDNYPNSQLLYRALNNAALISNQLDYKEEAIEYYNQILNSEANDKEEGGVGSGLMAEPYALYKNRAAKSLAEIYISQKKFNEALKYIDLTSKYPYQHFCGNEYAADEIYIATLYTKAYLGLNKVKEALDYSPPHIFFNGLADNSEILILALETIENNFSKKEIDSELDKGLKSIKMVVKEDYQVGIVNLFDRNIQLPDDSFISYTNESELNEIENLSEKENYQRIFKNSKFYKSL